MATRPGGSNQTGRPSYGDSTWGRMLRNDIEALKDEKSAVAKVFRSRFRVPYHVFEMVRECCSLTCSYTDLTYPPCLHYAPVLQIVGWVRHWLEAEKARADATGRAAVPVELKVLGVLRVLGRATCFDGIFELSASASPP